MVRRPCSAAASQCQPTTTTSAAPAWTRPPTRVASHAVQTPGHTQCRCSSHRRCGPMPAAASEAQTLRPGAAPPASSNWGATSLRERRCRCGCSQLGCRLRYPRQYCYSCCCCCWPLLPRGGAAPAAAAAAGPSAATAAAPVARPPTAAAAATPRRWLQAPHPAGHDPTGCRWAWHQAPQPQACWRWGRAPAGRAGRNRRPRPAQQGPCASACGAASSRRRAQQRRAAAAAPLLGSRRSRCCRSWRPGPLGATQSAAPAMRREGQGAGGGVGGMMRHRTLRLVGWSL